MPKEDSPSEEEILKKHTDGQLKDIFKAQNRLEQLSWEDFNKMLRPMGIEILYGRDTEDRYAENYRRKDIDFIVTPKDEFGIGVHLYCRYIDGDKKD